MMQVIEQTIGERTKMYMKCSKKELVTMLIANQDLVRVLVNDNNNYMAKVRSDLGLTTLRYGNMDQYSPNG